MRRTTLEIQYLEASDQTRIIKYVRDRGWACFWAGKPSEEEILDAMAKRDVAFYRYNSTTGETFDHKHSRRFTR